MCMSNLDDNHCEAVKKDIPAKHATPTVGPTTALSDAAFSGRASEKVVVALILMNIFRC